MSEWININDKSPPFDIAIEVMDDKGNKAVAFNQCYPPNIALTEIINMGEETEDNKDLDIDPLFWREIENV